MLNLWEKIQRKINGGITWTCPQCREQFFSTRWFKIEQKVKRHLRRVHRYRWKRLRTLGENIYSFMEKYGLIQE